MAEQTFSAWVGREEVSVDIVTLSPLARLAATFDRPLASDALLPPLGHWLFHLPAVAQSALGSDGHAARGDFLPPIALPRRMWAAGKLRFLCPVRIGDTIERRSRIVAVEPKQGAAGDMVFVTLRHDIAVGDSVAIEEEQILVYLAAATPGGTASKNIAPTGETSRDSRTADPAMLFRFSALTFNAHRIHYDLPYARDVEGYPSLVVQGPLQAMLLLDHLQRAEPDKSVASFDFRARAPLFSGASFDVCCAGSEGWIRDGDGQTTMTAQVGWT